MCCTGTWYVFGMLWWFQSRVLLLELLKHIFAFGEVSVCFLRFFVSRDFADVIVEIAFKEGTRVKVQSVKNASP